MVKRGEVSDVVHGEWDVTQDIEGDIQMPRWQGILV